MTNLLLLLLGFVIDPSLTVTRKTGKEEKGSVRWILVPSSASSGLRYESDIALVYKD